MWKIEDGDVWRKRLKIHSYGEWNLSLTFMVNGEFILVSKVVASVKHIPWDCDCWF